MAQVVLLVHQTSVCILHTGDQSLNALWLENAIPKNVSRAPGSCGEPLKRGVDAKVWPAQYEWISLSCAGGSKFMKHWSAKREQWDHSAGRIGIYIKTKASVLMTVFFVIDSSDSYLCHDQLF